MPKYTTDTIRNIAFLGASGTGKTTLTEAMLAHCKAIARTGKVEEGNTVSDFEDLEKEAGHSMDSAIMHVDHSGCHINVIDTPGRPDFFGKAVGALPAVETAVIVIDAATGVQPVTRRAMQRAKEFGVPTAIVINKIDASSGLDEVLGAIQEAFGSNCIPINVPSGGGSAIARCFLSGEGECDLGDMDAFHTAIVDQVVETDEELMEQYLEEGEVDPASLLKPFKQAMVDRHLIPVLFASAREGTGVGELLDQIAELFPSPIDGVARSFDRIDGEETSEVVSTGQSGDGLIAHVFKISSDPFVGKLSYIRVHQGSIKGGESHRLDSERKPVRISSLLKMQGRESKDLDSAIPGDICVVSKIDEVDFNSVFHAESGHASLNIRSIAQPKPMFGLAIEVTSKGAETKLSEAISKMIAEDQTLELERIAATNETVLRGLGELHLRAKLKMLKDRYGVEVDTRQPKVAYKETITGKAEGHHRHKKQTGGSGQFGEVYLRVEPATTEDEAMVNGLVFADETFGGSVPKQFLPAIEKGVRQVMGVGAVAGYPMQNVRVAVYDGKHHPVDSKEVAFVAAGKKAFVDAVQKAKPVLLEPFVKMEITVPTDMIGDISADLSGRRARIQGTDVLPGNQAVLYAEAPLSEVMSYSNQLKSITAGAGSYSMEYSHDENTPPNVQAEVIKAYSPTHDED
ncbi:MAG: elongation factor G [Phycisphaerales bacterium]|nr:elongation factor G [Phycisphaerales bacterium]